MATVHLQELNKQFGTGQPAVVDLNLDIAEGELLVLVGPSGCGKTTTLFGGEGVLQFVLNSLFDGMSVVRLELAVRPHI